MGMARMTDFAGGAGNTGGASSALQILKNNGLGQIAYNGGTVPAPSQVSPGSLNGGSVPAPSQRQPTGNPIQLPPQDMVYTDPRITNPGDNWANPLPAQQAAPQGPVQGGREWYNQLGAGAQAQQDQSWLSGDSDYTAQIAQYDKALQSFIDRIANQRKGFNDDAKLAMDATSRNQDMSLDNLGEDFGARGMLYGGVFDKSSQETNQRFNDAKSGIERIRTKNVADANARESDYRAENEISKSNAQRASLGRQAQRQALIDSMGAF